MDSQNIHVFREVESATKSSDTSEEHLQLDKVSHQKFFHWDGGQVHWLSLKMN